MARHPTRGFLIPICRISYFRPTSRTSTISFSCATPSTVVGIPHYDPYFRREAGSRDAFFRSVGLNPSKKLIVYAPVDDRRMRANELTRTWMENDLDRHILEILAGMDANIWVRFPPNTPVTIGDFKPPPHMVFERPGGESWNGICGRRTTSG